MPLIILEPFFEPILVPLLRCGNINMYSIPKEAVTLTYLCVCMYV